MSRSISLSLLLALTWSAAAVPSPEQAQAWKDATALVVLQGSDGLRPARDVRTFATAFCVNAREGLLISSTTSLRGAVELRLHPGTPQMKAIEARVIRIDAGKGLVILQTDDAKGMSELKLAENVPAEELDCTAAGSPRTGFVRTGGLEPGDYPAIHLYPVRTAGQKVGAAQNELIGFGLTSGVSGGPLIDAQGRLVGVISPIAENAADFKAISFSSLRQFMGAPIVRFMPTVMEASELTKETTFRVQMISILQPAPDYSVEAIFSARGERRFVPRQNEKGELVFTAAPVPKPTHAPQVRLTVQFADATVSCRALDQQVRIGQEQYRLSELANIAGGEQPGAMLKSGRRVDGAVEEASAIIAEVDGAPLKLNLGKALSVLIRPAEAPVTAVPYTIAVKNGPELVAEFRGVIGPVSPGTIPRVTLVTPREGPSRNETPAVDPRLQNKYTIKLRGAADDIVPAMGGELLLFHFKSLRQVALFNVSQRSL